MGVVYHAHQVKPIRRDVALKVIKPGMDSQQVIARFESERQALAMMDHANIARVFDAGTSEAGRLYFAMELVDGLPITKYCDSKGLTVQERIELFIPVCQAIQHAHQKGIIHRDIKPSNVLVKQEQRQPLVKVIDFGLAKAVGIQLSGQTMLTNFGTVVGTVNYMSPEQADMGRQDIDTRSDVYSLGALLYQVLSGTSPLDLVRTKSLGYLEILRLIREEDPEPPSQRLLRSANLAEHAERRKTNPERLLKQVSRELDWIVMKALEKDRTRRYETVNGIVRDLQRYLAGDPVDVGPPSAAYRMGKFIRKNRLLLATAAIFALLLAAGVVVSVWLALKASRAEQEAMAVNAFLRDDLLAQSSASTQLLSGNKVDPDLKLRTALDRAALRIEGKFVTQPNVDASIRLTLGMTYLDLGLYAEAQRHLERVFELRRNILGENNPETLFSMDLLANSLERQGKFSAAEPLYVKALEVHRRVLGERHPATLRSMRGLGAVFFGQGKYAQSEKLQAQVLEINRKLLGEEHAETAVSMGNLAALYHVRGKLEEAEPLYGRARDVLFRLLGEEHPQSLKVMTNLAELWGNQGKYGKSEQLYSRTLEVQRRVLGESHRSTLYTMNSLAEAFEKQDKFSQAFELYSAALASERRVFGEEHPFTLTSMNGLAEIHLGEHRFSQADALFNKVLEVRRRKLGAEHPATLSTMLSLGRLYTEQGKYAEAELLLTKVVETRKRVNGPQEKLTLNAIASLDDLRTRQEKAWPKILLGKTASAEPLAK